jgi:hypothetical protein
MLPKEPPPKWEEFLDEIDQQLVEPVDLRCIGGFVLTQLHGLPRPTGDIDVLTTIPSRTEKLIEIAGKGTALSAKYKLAIQIVGVANPPEDYESRLTEMFPGRFKNLRLMALDVYDVVLTKMERNEPRDLEDFKFLARNVPLDPTVLEERYLTEQRQNLLRPDREDGTLRFWLWSAFGIETTVGKN